MFIAAGYLIIASQLDSVLGLLVGFSIAYIGILAGARSVGRFKQKC